MKFKRLFGLFMGMILCFAMVGCADSSEDTESKAQDTKFIKDLEKATKDRWTYIDKVDKGTIQVDDDLEHLKECVKKESSILYKYKDAEFNDAKLKKLALDYIKGVETQENAFKYYTADTMKYDNEWSRGYDLRSTSLLAMVDEYGVKVNEKQFEELKTNAQVVKENNEVKKKIDEMLKNIKFEKVKDEYDWKDYSATIENTTGVGFNNFDLDIKLLDAEGVVIDSQYSYASNWKAGQKVKFEFSTDKDFSKLEWEATYYISE